MPRRQYGSGSVFQRTDGRWVGRVEAGYTRAGGRRRIVVLGKTKAEATLRLKEKRRQIAAEGLPEAGTGRATVKSWADVWLPRHATAVRPNTYTADRGAVTKWVIPAIGHKRLDALTPGDVRSVRTAVIKAGRSSTTARQVHWTLMGMLKAAVLDGHQVPPRALVVEAPVKAVNDRTAIPLDQALAILTAALARPDKARWVASLLQGMRQGEVLGLTWECVDLDAGTLDVSWQLQALPYVDRRTKPLGFRVPDGYEHRHLIGGWHLTRPKTASGRRLIPLVPWMTAALTEWAVQAPANPWGLVWSAAGRPVDPRADREQWAAIQEEVGVQHPAGRPYIGHEARHATATWLLEAGVDPKTVETLLGHSSILTSRGYQHVSTALARQAMEAVAIRLGLTVTGSGSTS